MIRVKGRVMSVSLSDRDGMLFTVTVGPAPRLFVFRTARPPKLGQRVAIAGTVTRETPLGAHAGTITVLEIVSCEVIGEARRVVDPVWLERVQAVMSRPLMSYQIDGAGWLAARLNKGVGGILGDDMGLGKTAQAIAALCAVNAFPAVIVCPASVKFQWAEEFQYASDVPEIEIVHARHGPLSPAHVFVINYDLLKWREAQLAALRPRLYVFDEGQQLKHPKARGKHRAAVATRLVRPTGGAVILTGTPVLNHPVELWRLLHLAEPKAWPSFSDYQERFCQPKRGKEVGRSMRTRAGRVERLDELQAAVAPVMLRRLKGDVLEELPPKHRRSALVRLGDAELSHYQSAAKDVTAWLREIGQTKRALHAARAPGLARLTYLRRIAAMGKLRGAVPGYLEAWTAKYPGEPLVIFGYHRDVMLGLWNLCQSMGLKTTGIGGGESLDKRQARVEMFKNGEVDVFLAPIAVGGTALNGLQRACNALFVERIWNPSGLLQAEDRIHRLGQKRPVIITYLDAQGTVDEHIADVVGAKQQLISVVVDDDARGSESISTVVEVMGRMRGDEVG